MFHCGQSKKLIECNQIKTDTAVAIEGWAYYCNTSALEMLNVLALVLVSGVCIVW